MSTRRAKPGGWVKQRQRRPCRWCGAAVPAGRFTFCGEACVHQWKLRTDPGYLRAQVFARDRGVCAACGLDTEALRRNKRKLDYRARREFEHRRAFRDKIKWRTGSEGRINHIKRSYGWNRTELTGINGARTWCGHGVFAHNLVKITTLAS